MSRALVARVKEIRLEPQNGGRRFEDVIEIRIKKSNIYCDCKCVVQGIKRKRELNLEYEPDSGCVHIRALYSGKTAAHDDVLQDLKWFENRQSIDTRRWAIGIELTTYGEQLFGWRWAARALLK